MYINKPSATKIEAADRVDLLHSAIYRFEQWESRKVGQLLVSFLAQISDCHQKTLPFRHTN